MVVPVRLRRVRGAFVVVSRRAGRESGFLLGGTRVGDSLGAPDVAAEAFVASLELVRLGDHGLLYRDLGGVFRTVTVSFRTDAVYRALRRLVGNHMAGVVCGWILT
jgi:hypothetical protein